MWWSDLEGTLFGDYPGFKIRKMAILKSSLLGRCFDVGSKRSWPFLEEKSRDEVRPDIFGATAPRRIRFTEKIERYACGRSILIRILMKQMKNEVNFRRKCGNSGNGSHLRAKIVDFLRDGTLVVLLTKHNSGHVARIGTHCRSCRAEPARYAYWLGRFSRFLFYWSLPRLPPPG